MIIGNINNINRSTSFFERMIVDRHLYVDKTRMIEHFLTVPDSVQLIARQRRLGKSLNMDMLKCFLTDKEDLRHLFMGLYIESSPVWNKAHSAPVFLFDFKGLKPTVYKKQILAQVRSHIRSVTPFDDLEKSFIEHYEDMTNDLDLVVDSLRFLTELVHGVTGKCSYLLIDEYDKLLVDNYNTEKYDEILDFERALLLSGLKGNPYLEKALLTGVMRVSRESMFSELNNVAVFDVFRDKVYADDYGLTDEEVGELNGLVDFNKSKLREWYNGVRIGDKAIYNTFSVISYLTEGEYGCFWGKSGALEMIIDLFNDERKLVLSKLMNGEQVEVPAGDRISLKQLSRESGDNAFYSLLIQGGYLSLEKYKENDEMAIVSIPNLELKAVWRNFIFACLYNSSVQLKTLFDNSENVDTFAADIEYFLSDRLSYHDLGVPGGNKTLEARKAKEQIYHTFMLGILCAYEDARNKVLSNRESGDGRFDILYKRPEANYIFEFKACTKEGELESKAEEALKQIEINRYGADLRDNKRLVKTGIAFYKKLCKVKCG